MNTFPTGALHKIAVFAKASLMAAVLTVSGQVSAQFQKGPNPTAASLERVGSFATRTTTVSRSSAAGAFGGGTIYYPTTVGTYGVIAISPGYTAYQSSISSLGSRIASHGFVVITIDTLTTGDQPDSRGRQLKAALDTVVRLGRTSGSALYNKVDGTRMGVAGHSMGGGGSLSAARDNPTLKAAVPLAPWHASRNFSRLAVPTLIIGGQGDTIAGVAQHSIPFYNSIPVSTKKGYMEMRNGSHFFPQLPTNTALVGKYMISWFKRFVDADTRYSPFLCGAPHQIDLTASTKLSNYRENCPY